ncbi:acetyl-CoA carboxylase biotin carboxyl carrier protein subunit, partial [Rhizobium ruizarguesonis]
VVNAPMVGTVYLAPAPGARPFIEVGATVKEGQTLIIIEAMKTMNQIPSPKSGKVTEILVDDDEGLAVFDGMSVIDE